MRIDIQHILAFQNFDVDEIIQHAVKAKDIANYQTRKFSSSKWVAVLHKRFHQNQILLKVVVPHKKVFSKPESHSRNTCFHCKQQGHRSFQCPKRINLIEGEGDVKDTPNDPKGNDTEEVEELGPMEGLESLMVLKVTSPTIEKKWL